MGLTMRERKAVTREVSKRYRKAGKKAKGKMLDEFCELTGYNRCYGARVLREEVGKDPRAGKGLHMHRRGLAVGRRGRKRKYGPEVVGPLKRLWAVADGICGKRLAAIMVGLIQALERFGEISLRPEARRLLMEMSAATIDRLLAPERRKVQLKRRSGTKPGSLLKSQIPVRTFSEWNEKAPGFVEVDLVAHDGGDPRGEFIQTLDMVDVCSGWTETRAVKNKAQIWVFQALKEVRASLPFPLRGLDCDNGAEFINAHLLRYCQQHGITFTRSRPYRKNDSCHVEQKNWNVVRRAVGYQRYDTQEELDMLNRLYDVLRLYTNFFQPSVKLLRKTRQGSKVIKEYDRPQTPCQRLLGSEHLSAEAKYRLSDLYHTVNPAQLQRDISTLQETLYAPVKNQTPKPTKEVTTLTHFEYILADATK